MHARECMHTHTRKNSLSAAKYVVKHLWAEATDMSSHRAQLMLMFKVCDITVTVIQ